MSNVILRIARQRGLNQTRRIVGIANGGRTIASYNLRNINSTWKSLGESERDQIIDYLALRQEESWRSLTQDEKRACYYISFGVWGPRLVLDRDAASGSISSRVISALSASIFLIALGLSLYNYTIDQEKLEEFNRYEQINPEN